MVILMNTIGGKKYYTDNFDDFKNDADGKGLMLMVKMILKIG